MRERARTTLSLLRGVHQFLAEVPVPRGNLDVMRVNERLGACIEQLAAHGVAIEYHGRAKVAATAKIRALARSGRREHLRVVAQAAKIAFTKESGLQRAFRVPRTMRRPLVIADTLRGVADAAGTYRADFAAGGLQGDFPERLHAMADAIVDAVAERDMHVARLRGATAGSIAAAAEGSAIVGILDGLVRSRLREHHESLAQWDAIRRKARHKRYERTATA